MTDYRSMLMPLIVSALLAVVPPESIARDAGSTEALRKQVIANAVNCGSVYLALQWIASAPKYRGESTAAEYRKLAKNSLDSGYNAADDKQAFVAAVQLEAMALQEAIATRPKAGIASLREREGNCVRETIRIVQQLE